jgi:hypothetical protein
VNAFDSRHVTPPTIGSSGGRRVRGRPGQTSSRLTRRPHITDGLSSQNPAGHDDARKGLRLAEWHTMTEPEHVLAWAQLREWVTWLIGRYRLPLEDRLPACWPQHPELIEELWALHGWRTEAYGPDGTGQSAVYWHQALTTFLTHVAAWWAGGCRAGHQSPNTDIEPEHAEAWAAADPLIGIPTALRPAASIPTNPDTGPGVITMPDLNVLTAAQMHALTTAGLAHPHHEIIAAFTYYDGSWWAYASPKNRAPETSGDNSEQEAIWFRADDVDLACDPTFHSQPLTAS